MLLRSFTLATNLPRSMKPLTVWRRYKGRADIENRIKELGDQFAVKRLACRGFWATEALHQMAITAYNLCVLHFGSEKVQGFLGFWLLLHAGQSTFEATVEQVHPVPAAFGNIPLHQVSAGGVGWQFCEIGFDLGDLGFQGGQQIANLLLGLAARKVQARAKTSTVDRRQ